MSEKSCSSSDSNHFAISFTTLFIGVRAVCVSLCEVTQSKQIFCHNTQILRLKVLGCVCVCMCYSYILAYYLQVRVGEERLGD